MEAKTGSGAWIPRIVVRGGGDIATGVIYELVSAGYPVVVLETARPSAIRRNVAFSEAVYEGRWQVEGMTAYLADSPGEAMERAAAGAPAVLVDPEGETIPVLKPDVVVDAILAKKNLGTHRGMAPLTIALGPGFRAGEDVDVVIETMRGHRLGRVLRSGSALPNTGVPGVIAGYGRERVIHAPAAGRLKNVRHITDFVKKGEIIAQIIPQGEEAEEQNRTKNGERCETALEAGALEKRPVEVRAALDGILRGLLRDGFPVTKGFKIADIDPRSTEYENCFTISDKARCIGGGVLWAVAAYQNGRRRDERQ